MFAVNHRWSNVCVVIATAVLAVSCAREQTPTTEENILPLRVAPEFTAVDQNGNEFNSSSMKGKPWLASFFFTSCESVCPALNTIQADLQRRYSDKISFVSISTDPDTDTKEALATYAQQYSAKNGVWYMVRMPIEQVRNVAVSGFALMDPKEPSMHSTRLAAVDKNMHVVGYFDSEDTADMKKLNTWISSQ